MDPEESGLDTNLFLSDVKKCHIMLVRGLLEPDSSLVGAAAVWKLLMAFEDFVFWVELKARPNL